MNPTLLRNYINGFKKPSKEREQEIANTPVCDLWQTGVKMINMFVKVVGL